MPLRNVALLYSENKREMQSVLAALVLGSVTAKAAPREKVEEPDDSVPRRMAFWNCYCYVYFVAYKEELRREFFDKGYKNYTMRSTVEIDNVL